MRWSIPEKIVERGRQYMEEGRVLSILPNEESVVWYGEVLGTEMYQVILDGTAKEKDQCSCEYWETRGYCEHTVAAELELKKRGFSRVMQENQKKVKEANSQSLTQLFAQQAAVATPSYSSGSSATKEARKLKIKFEIENLITMIHSPEKAALILSLKIGSEHTGNRVYAIPRIDDFFLAYEGQKTYLVNQQLFHLKKSYFTEDTRNLLDHCLRIFHKNRVTSPLNVRMNGRLTHKYLLIPVESAKILIQQLVRAKKLHLNIENREYKTIQFTSELPTIHFHVEQDSDGYLLQVESPIDFYWEEYLWLLSGEKITEINPQQEEIYRMLLGLLKRVKSNEIHYRASDVHDLFSFVLPMLEQIGKVTIAKRISKELLYVPLKSYFYLTLTEDNEVFVRVDFHYEETIYSTDIRHSKNSKKNQTIIRQKSKETQVFDLLRELDFTRKSSYYGKELPRGKELYLFFTEEIPKLEKYGRVEVSEEIKRLVLDPEDFHPDIRITQSGSWLDVQFDISGIAEDEIDAVMERLVYNDPYYTTKQGELLLLNTPEFQKTSEALVKVRQSLQHEGGHFAVPSYRSLQIAEVFSEEAMGSFSQEFEKMVYYLTHPVEFPARLPNHLQAELRSYQEIGFHWLRMLQCYNFGGILADDMGLGKTLQTITFLLSLVESRSSKGVHLVVAPASLIYNWQAECKKFAPSLKVEVIAGTKEERKQLLFQTVQPDVWVTSYPCLRQDIDMYKQCKLGTLILDEAQVVKNANTKIAKAIQELTTENRFALSGTPIENKLDELRNLFEIIMPGFFPSQQAFKLYEPKQVSKMIAPFVLRREKAEVLEDLPEKIETNLYSALTEQQKTVYLAYLKKMQKDVQSLDSEGFRKNRMHILAGLTRLRQICCDPGTFIDDYQGDSGKVLQVKELLLSAKDNKRKVLLFSQFTSMLDRLENELTQMGLSTLYLKGSTPSNQRLDMVDRFNEGEKDVFLISLKAGGTGLNLTGADTVILYDLWWNPAVEDQATSRAHRMGQKKVVEVWRLIAEGTIEEKIDALQQQKKDLFQQVLNPEDEKQLEKLTEEDIRDILHAGELH